MLLHVVHGGIEASGVGASRWLDRRPPGERRLAGARRRRGRLVLRPAALGAGSVASNQRLSDRLPFCRAAIGGEIATNHPRVVVCIKEAAAALAVRLPQTRSGRGLDRDWLASVLGIHRRLVRLARQQKLLIADALRAVVDLGLLIGLMRCGGALVQVGEVRIGGHHLVARHVVGRLGAAHATLLDALLERRGLVGGRRLPVPHAFLLLMKDLAVVVDAGHDRRRPRAVGHLLPRLHHAEQIVWHARIAHHRARLQVAAGGLLLLLRLRRLAIHASERIFGRFGWRRRRRAFALGEHLLADLVHLVGVGIQRHPARDEPIVHLVRFANRVQRQDARMRAVLGHLGRLHRRGCLRDVGGEQL